MCTPFALNATNYMKRNYTMLIIGLFVAIVIVSILFLNSDFLKQLMTIRVNDANGNDSRLNRFIAIPLTATDVNYEITTFPYTIVRLNFKISEEEFFRWANQQQWEISKILGTVTVVEIDNKNRNNEKIISLGFISHNMGRGKKNVYCTVYDSSDNCVYYFFTGKNIED